MATNSILDVNTSTNSLLIFAHRGYSVEAPENTLAAFDLCVERGVPGIELDIHLTRSNELVVAHDFDLKRVTGDPRRIAECDYAAFQGLDAGSWFDRRFHDQRIPLLSEVFKRYGDRLYYDIEIKDEEHGPSPVVPVLHDLIRRHGLESRVLISSFNPTRLAESRQLDDALPTALIYDTTKLSFARLRSAATGLLSRTPFVKPNNDTVTPAMVRLCALIGRRRVLPWVVNDRDEAARLVRVGVAGFVTRNPGALL